MGSLILIFSGCISQTVYYYTKNVGLTFKLFRVLISHVFNNNGAPVTTTLSAFGTFGSFFDIDPMYSEEVTLEDGWNNVTVSGWDFNNKFIIFFFF